MAERRGRVGGGGGDPWIAREAEADFDVGGRGARARIGRPTGLLALLASGLVIYLAGSVLWERSHPAASAARKVGRGDRATRLRVIRDLGSLGPQDPEVAVPALIDGLADPDPSNRVAAADCLVAATQGIGTTGSGAQVLHQAVAALTRQLADPESSVRVRAATALCTIVWTWQGSPWMLDPDAMEAELARMADGPDAEARSAAVHGLSALAQRVGAAPSPRVFAALEDPSERVRNAAARGLATSHRRLVQMLPALVKAMESTRPECRPAYLGVLRRFRPSEFPRESAGDLILTLIAALRSRDRDLRCEVIALLGAFGRDAQPAIPALLAAIEDPGCPGLPGTASEGFRGAADPAIAAAQALRRVAGDDGPGPPSPGGPTDPAIVPGLIRLLGSPAAGRRLAAIYALSSFEADDAVVAALIEASRDADEWVRAASVQALEGRGRRLRSRSLETIRAALEDPSPRVRTAATIALSDFGPGIESMLPALIRHAHDDPDPVVRSMSAGPLGHVRPPDISPAVIPMYRAAIDRPGAPDRLRQNLIAGLVAFGPAARNAVPTIVRALRSTGQGGRRDSLPDALPEPDVSVAGSAARDRDELRGEAAGALGVLAPGTPWAVEAVAALTEALDDPADVVNEPATASLLAFGPAARGSAPALLRALDRAWQQKRLLRAGRLVEAVAQLDPAAPGVEQAITFLGGVLHSGDLPQRLFAERVLVLFGPAAAPAVPELLALARRSARGAGPEPSSIATALGRLAPGTPSADQAVAVLVQWLRVEPVIPGIDAVIDALARFGPVAAPARPRLRQLATSAHPTTAEAARRAVDLLGKAEG